MYLRRNRTTEFTECQAFSTVVRIGSARPPPRQRMLAPPPIWFQGGTHSLAGEEVGGANSDEGMDTLVL
jgi:hypothetical protein